MVRQRWDTLFCDNDTTAGFRNALRLEQDDKLCNDGLRSICWKACACYCYIVISVAYLGGVGLPAFRRSGSGTVAAEALGYTKRLRRLEGPFPEIY